MSATERERDAMRSAVAGKMPCRSLSSAFIFCRKNPGEVCFTAPEGLDGGADQFALLDFSSALEDLFDVVLGEPWCIARLPHGVAAAWGVARWEQALAGGVPLSAESLAILNGKAKP